MRYIQPAARVHLQAIEALDTLLCSRLAFDGEASSTTPSPRGEALPESGPDDQEPHAPAHPAPATAPEGQQEAAAAPRSRAAITPPGGFAGLPAADVIALLLGTPTGALPVVTRYPPPPPSNLASAAQKRSALESGPDRLRLFTGAHAGWEVGLESEWSTTVQRAMAASQVGGSERRRAAAAAAASTFPLLQVRLPPPVQDLLSDDESIPRALLTRSDACRMTACWPP